MAIITMTQTVGSLTSGQTYRVRAKNAELLVKASQATIAPVKKIIAVNPHQYEGK